MSLKEEVAQVKDKLDDYKYNWPLILGTLLLLGMFITGIVRAVKYDNVDTYPRQSRGEETVTTPVKPITDCSKIAPAPLTEQEKPATMTDTDKLKALGFK